jgi:hypothetical protein
MSLQLKVLRLVVPSHLKLSFGLHVSTNVHLSFYGPQVCSVLVLLINTGVIST